MKRLCLLLLLLPTLCACQWITDDYDDEMANATRYINITISVSADNIPVTRAPQGGEYGDGDEQGIDTRENYVENITLIFYQDNTGINTPDNDAEVSFVKTYSVYRTDDYPYSHTHTHTTPEPTGYAAREIIYTTGDQKLEETELVVGQSYKVLVVANANVDVAKGDKISTVREKTFSQIYEGTGLGPDAEKFVMTSEGDVTITLAYPWINIDENKAIYYSDCIHIERLAARIDYCTRGAEYNASYGGYIYEKEKPGNKIDYYVVTKVTPFNLYNEPEYYFKRVRDTWADGQTPTITYLGDESTTNWVVDPHTAEKTTITHGAGPVNDDAPNPDVSYINRLDVMLPADGPDNTYPDNSYSQVMATVHSTSSHTDEQNNNNIVIAYPRENTLLPNSLFKWYATGIVFEVDIYRDANTANPKPKETKRYYHYLRHQGEQLDANNYSFKAKELKKNEVERDKETCVFKGEGPGANEVLVPMRCGIVRNNIYRVSIASFSDEEGTITLTIEEEKWRHVDNPTIYI